jgi:hypothetical protein
MLILKFNEVNVVRYRKDKVKTGDYFFNRPYDVHSPVNDSDNKQCTFRCPRTAQLNARVVK